eukprot:gene9140-18942_t
MGSWVDDFSTFQKSNSGGSGISLGASVSKSVGKGLMTKPQTRSDKIKAELKLLEWHKLANDSAIKAAILQTKMLKEDNEVRQSPDQVETSKWMKHVIDDEHNKPLEVSKDFVINFEKKEKESQEKLTNQMEKHINTLKMLRTKLEEQSELQARQEEFREWKKDFKSKKAAVLTGRTLAELNYSVDKVTRDSGGGGGAHTRTYTRPPATGQARELSTVMDSLTKLAELERRISSLEKDNAYEEMSTSLADRPLVSNHTTLEFRKKRTAGGPKESVRTVFAVRERKQAWLPDPLARGGRKPVASMSGRTGRDGGRGNGRGTFLTAGPETETDDFYREETDARALAKRERARLIALAPVGQKALRARIQTKKERAKVVAAGTKRHEQALMQMNNRRVESLVRARPAPVFAGKGASAGIKFKNKHMQDFQNIKNTHSKRR